MSALTSLLARDQAVPVRKIEEALQRQVMGGGDIGSALLEGDALGENALAAYSAALVGLLPATRDEVMRVARDVIRLVPREVAEKHRLVPLSVDGRTLLVALATPLESDTEKQLGFLLGYDIITRVVCDVRIAAALQHHYAVEPTPRHRRLIEQLRHREAGPVPYVAPPDRSLQTDRSALAKKSVSSWLDDADEPDNEAPPSSPPPPSRSTSLPPPTGRTTDPMGVPKSQVLEMVGELASSAADESDARHTLPGLPTAPLPTPSKPSEAPPAPARTLGVGVARSAPPPAHPEPSEHPSDLPVLPPLGADLQTYIPRATPPPIVELVVDDEPQEDAARATLELPPSPPPNTPRTLVGAAAPEPPRAAVAPTSSTPAVHLHAEAPRSEPAREPARSEAPRKEPLRAEPVRTETRNDAAVARAEARAQARKLRGPLTAAQASKLLEDASERDAIVEVLFAFARQFFDYAALFSVTDDRADGRDAFGDGAPAAQVRTLSFTLSADVDDRSLLPTARRSLMPQVRAFETERDVELARALQRPVRATALAYPIAIRGRVVLVLYGDRDGDDFDLTDIPELLGFVPRVIDAIERLILRRKRDGYATKASIEAAKPTEAAPRSSGRPLARSADRWSATDSHPSQPTMPAAPVATRPSTSNLALVDAIATALPASEPSVAEVVEPRATEPGPAAEPGPVAGPSSRPTSDDTLHDDVDPASPAEALRPTTETRRPDLDPIAEARRDAPRPVRRSASVRGLLGIPRAAPPPPTIDDAALGLANEPLAPSEGPRTIPAPPPDGSDDEPELVIGASDETGSDDRDDDEPELVIGASDETDSDDRDDDDAPSTAPSRTSGRRPTYIVHDVAAEVFEPRGRRASSDAPRSNPPSSSPPEGRTPSQRAARRYDPRREDDGPMQSDVIVASRKAVSAPPPADATSGSEPPRPTHDRDVPAVIVDMGDSVSTLVEDLVHAGPDGDAPAIDALLKVGEAALPVLAQAFPGPLWFDRRRAYRRLPRGRDVSAIARALVTFRERSAPYVAALLRSTPADRRFYAAIVASELPAGVLVEPLVQRTFDEDAGVRALALEILPKFRSFPEIAEQLVVLRRTARIRGKEPVRRLYALAALAALRDGGSLRTLVDLLEDEDIAVQRASHGALVQITCEDLGESSRRWTAWADRNESRHRIEWLIDALVHADEGLRTQAAEDLKNLTQQYFGYHAAAPRKEREVVQAKYRVWWESQGRALFSV